MNLDIIERAGLTQTEFGELFVPPVARVTVNNWVRGRSNPNTRIVAELAVVVETLEAAVAAGKLPIDKEAIRKSATAARRSAVAAAVQ